MEQFHICLSSVHDEKDVLRQKSEAAALQIPDVQVSARRGLLIIRRSKGLKHRESPLVQEARELLDAYFNHCQHLAEHWREPTT